MQSTLTIHLGNDRTYITAFEPTAKGLELMYINSIPERIGIDGDIIELKHGLEAILPELNGKFEKLRLCFPDENIFVHQFPAVKSGNIEEVKQLLGLEIRQAYPQHSLEDYRSIVIPLIPKLDGKEMMIAMMIDRQQVHIGYVLSEILGLPCERMVVSQFSSHAALLYNYPEQIDNTVILFGVHDRFADVSVLKKGELAYYGLVPFNSNEGVAVAFEKEIEKLLTTYIPFADSAFLFGPGLTSSILSSLSSSLPVPTQRLNAFRMMTTQLNDREREYCIKSAHLYPPNVGAALPELQSSEMIKL
ncbi:MAG: hypothetical protein HYZ54_10145 [Ignavibacteriae bacterium]|nr:hypothetical protein [Ignavibacteriota bacterium]